MQIFSMDTCYPCFEWMPGPSVVPLNDEITATQDGIYTIWISNERAWWHTLSVVTKINVIGGEKEALEGDLDICS